MGPGVPAEARPVLAPAARARSASRSTPRPGSGTGSTSAASAARSSTRGGRPRPGAILITPAARASRRSSRGRPRCRSPGSRPTSYDEEGHSVPLGGGGYLVLKRPWPAMARTIWGDPDRYVQTYFGKYGRDGLRRRRRRQARRGRLLLAARADRRRDERGRAIASRRTRSRAPWWTTRRWRRPLSCRRPDDARGRGHRGVRHAEGRATRATTRWPRSFASTWRR